MAKIKSTDDTVADPSDMVAISHPDQPGFVKRVTRRTLPARLGSGWVEASAKDVDAQPEPGTAMVGGSDRVAISHPDSPDFVKVVSRSALAGRADGGWTEVNSPEATALVEAQTSTEPGQESTS